MKNKMKLGMYSALLVSSLVGGVLITEDLVAHASTVKHKFITGLIIIMLFYMVMTQYLVIMVM